MNFCIFDVITYSFSSDSEFRPAVVIWWIFVSLMWLHTAKVFENRILYSLWFDEFLYLWCDYIQQCRTTHVQRGCCDLMNFCIFDVITYSDGYFPIIKIVVVIWWIFVSLMWLHTASLNSPCTVEGCDLMNFCIFDVITYSSSRDESLYRLVVIWWIFVSLMWLHTALSK